MDESFEIPVTFNAKEILFPASLVTSGYTYKIHVDVYGQLVSFERDEERNFRAVINGEEMDKSAKMDKELIKEIANTLESLFK